MTGIFDFKPDLVELAMHGESEPIRTNALRKLCTAAFNDYSCLEREIVRRNPEWPMEWLDRARDLFIHDRFLSLFANPPKEKIEDINALCYKMLKDSINDAYRFFMASRRSVKKEIRGDATGYGKDGLQTFWEVHEADILLASSERATVSLKVEQADLMRIINRHLSLMPLIKKRVLLMWMSGYTEREISKDIGLTTGNVGCIINRTISFLRKKICKKV